MAYNTRDDTVPWVRRLIALMQQADPDAMKGDYGVDSVDAVAESPYFVGLERRNFRNWVPITRAGHLRWSNADRSPLDWTRLSATSCWPRWAISMTLLPARPSPSCCRTASCWRAVVDHSSLALEADQDALHIRL